MLIDIANIYYIEKDGQYSNVVTKDKTYSVKYTIKHFKEGLSKSSFGIVSQGFLANYKYVKEENKEYVLMVDNHISYYSRGKRSIFIKEYLRFITSI